MFMGPIQIEIWATYLCAVLNWQCCGETWVFTKETCLDQKKTQNTTSLLGDSVVLEISAAAQFVKPQTCPDGQSITSFLTDSLSQTEDRARARAHTRAHTHTHTHTHWAPQSVWTRRSRAKTPPSPGIKAQFPDVLAHSLDSIPTESLVPFPSLRLLKTI
jgi:hypothetical protein